MTEPTNVEEPFTLADAKQWNTAAKIQLDEARADLDKARELIDRNWPEPNITQIRVERDAARTRAGVAETELATAREALEALKRHEWFVGKAAKARAAQPGTVADLTERLVAASSEWDDNTGDHEETSRPYLEHLAKAIAQPATVTPTSFGATAVRQLRAEMPDLTKTSETAEEYGYRQAFERICDWLEYEYKPVPAEAGDNEGCGGPGCVSFGGCAVCGPEAAMEEALAAEAGDSTADETPGARWLSDREYEVGNQASPSAETVEPVSTTLQRVINDLHAVAATLNPEGIANPEDISHEDKVGAHALIEYAQRLRKHPALAQGGAS